MGLASRITSALDSNLARASAGLFTSSIAVGLLGYVFQVVMARLMNATDYGVFSALMAIFAVATAPLGTLVMIVSRKVSEYRARDSLLRVSDFYWWMNTRSAVWGGLMLGIALALTPQISYYTKTDSPVLIYLLIAFVYATIFPTINTGFLQGLQKFAWLSASYTLSVVLKILMCALFVWLGYGIAGALGGAAFAAILSWVLTFVAMRTVLRRSGSSGGGHLELRSALPVLLANSAFAVMAQIDMVLVNYYFPAQLAGLYAAASVMGKAIMYLPGGIALALFPMVAERHVRSENDRHLFWQSISLTMILCLSGSIAYLAFADRIILMLYGEQYRLAAPVLKYFGFAMLPMALIMVAENFLIAKGKVLFAYLFLFAAPVEVLVIRYHHESLETVVAIVGASGTALVLVGCAVIAKLLRDENTVGRSK